MSSSSSKTCKRKRQPHVANNATDIHDRIPKGFTPQIPIEHQKVIERYLHVLEWPYELSEYVYYRTEEVYHTIFNHKSYETTRMIVLLECFLEPPLYIKSFVSLKPFCADVMRRTFGWNMEYANKLYTQFKEEKQRWYNRSTYADVEEE